MYPNMDRILEYINAHSDELGFTAEYSTLSKYFDALHAEKHHWNTAQHGDFLPYSDPAPQGQVATLLNTSLYLDTHLTVIR